MFQRALQTWYLRTKLPRYSEKSIVWRSRASIRSFCWVTAASLSTLTLLKGCVVWTSSWAVTQTRCSGTRQVRAPAVCWTLNLVSTPERHRFMPPAQCWHRVWRFLTEASLNVHRRCTYECSNALTNMTSWVPTKLINNAFCHTAGGTRQPSSEGVTSVYPTHILSGDGTYVHVVQAYAYGKYLGHLTVTFDDDGNVVTSHGNPILLDSETLPGGWQVRVD